ncbi:MAG: hypothetical protein FWE67_06780 [Planctomycetaceae bacterium]|nr:hypothetical protein [Planctomycetaceae bacterium]
MSTQSLPNVPEQNTGVELTEEERERKIWAYYEQEVLKAIESDRWIPGTPEFWENLRKEAHERREARKTSAALRNQ